MGALDGCCASLYLTSAPGTSSWASSPFPRLFVSFLGATTLPCVVFGMTTVATFARGALEATTACETCAMFVHSNHRLDRSSTTHLVSHPVSLVTHTIERVVDRAPTLRPCSKEDGGLERAAW